MSPQKKFTQYLLKFYSIFVATVILCFADMQIKIAFGGDFLGMGTTLLEPILRNRTFFDRKFCRSFFGRQSVVAGGIREGIREGKRMAILTKVLF